MNPKEPYKLFLLGGHDLEMLTIKQMLEGRAGCMVADKQLCWNNALLSAYEEELTESADCQIYGIELQEDIPAPDNYHAVDHHNEKSELPSALEQVSALLGVSLTRYQQLVAANDKGYIRAMQSLGASNDEIDEIREKDRKAQGVTEEDEALAERSVKENKFQLGKLTIVKALTHNFSAISDRLFPYENLLVYTDEEWTFYGDGKKALVKELAEEIALRKVYHGGGDSGYIGAVHRAFKTEEIAQFVYKIKEKALSDMSTYSFHSFMFPFQWKIKGFSDKTFSEQVSLKNISYSVGSNWKRIHTPSNEAEANNLYNERNYFYEFVHSVLYDDGNEDSNIRHYERMEPQCGLVTYKITCAGGRVYELRVAAINLDLYSTGVGVLSFFMYNDSYPELADILNINQYGRRVFPPFISDVNNRYEIAQCLEFVGLNGNVGSYREDFERYTNATGSNVPATFVSSMIAEVATNIELKPVIDDRMFVLCWYKNNRWAKDFTVHYEQFLKDPHWYEFVFVDKYDGLSCQNELMQEKLIKKATYERWQKWSSLYGISRYSMVYLTNDNCPPYLTQYFETEYARMAELILLQKASVLRFSAEINNISQQPEKSNIGKSVNSVYLEYIRFLNQIHFYEVSAQDQGIEMYSKLYDTMGLQCQVEKLNNEISELHNYITLREDYRINNTMSLLTWIATIIVPITVVSGIFNMSNTSFHIADGAEDKLLWFNYAGNQFLLMGIATLLFITIVLILKKKSIK